MGERRETCGIGRPSRDWTSVRRRARTWYAAWLFAAVLAGPLPAQQEIFEQGNQRYQAGEYAAAINAYEAVFESGFRSHDLHYNLGNAYFKHGDLGRAILNWERALALEPGDPDALANLDLADRLKADQIEPLPRFWLLSVFDWALNVLPRAFLLLSVGAAWLALATGVVLRILARSVTLRRGGSLLAGGGALVVLLLGANLLVRELGIGRAERGVILSHSVPARSAPSADDNLTVFEVHEGTRVRIDQRTDEWAEIVLPDGKVGWVPVDVMEVI
jgi:tetratricopeptide (TPR) repeat protein